MKRFIPFLIFVAVIYGGIRAYEYFTSPAMDQTTKVSRETETTTNTPTGVKSTDISMPNSTNPNPMIIDAKKVYQAVITTSVGSITVDLTTAATPITVNNFVTLARKGFYNNTVFHRVIDGFMIQGGDPEGNGTGGPGYKFDDEPFSGEYSRGTVAMANSGPNTNGSQFFIMHKDYPLPKNYVIFGSVIDGLDTVDKIASAAVKINPMSGEKSVPVVPVTIVSVEITEK